MSLGLKPVPDTRTDFPFVIPVLGVTTSLGLAAALALVLSTPLVSMPVLSIAATPTTRIVRIDITLSPTLFDSSITGRRSCHEVTSTSV